MADGARDNLDISVVSALGDVPKADWDALANPDGAPFDPFIAYDFLKTLEETGCVGPETGWTPMHLLARDDAGALVGAMPLYAKSHSYGEYVFDHAWADAMRRAGGRYYPKLQCASPFTPVTGRRLLTQSDDVRVALALAASNVAQRIGASSVHATFVPEAEQAALAPLGYLKRTGLQFHWTNPGYGSFDDFLVALSSSKRKNIRKEREKAREGLALRRLSGADITPGMWDFFFECYMDTGSRKWGSPYLNRAFFHALGRRMGDRCLLFVAERDGKPIASALNLIGSDTLFGRYWGALEHVPFLHFELCYYQAIDYAIERGFARVEAGAQGEHKLLRGYEPVPTYSAHWIAHAGLRRAIADFLAREGPAVIDEIEALAEHTPFKKSNQD